MFINSVNKSVVFDFCFLFTSVFISNIFVVFILNTFFNTSLGILAKYLQKGKFFTKKKVVFLLVSSLIRKMLLYSSLKDLILMLKRTPMYLQEILSLINNKNKFMWERNDLLLKDKKYYVYFTYTVYWWYTLVY
jgi:hypothetical protein